MKHWSDKLVALNACPDAVEWAEDYDSLADAWAECERGDWMLWLAGAVSGKPESKSRKVLVSAACECARTTWQQMPDKSKHAIETAEKWVDGKATLDEVRAAAADATDAAATDAAAWATDAAAWAAADAALAAANVERKKGRKKCADIARKHYPNPPRMRTGANR